MKNNDPSKDIDYETRIAQVKAEILEAMLENVIFDGWSADNFNQSCAQAHIDKSLAALAFPRGAIDVIAYMHRSIDADFFEKLPLEIADEPSLTRKISLALKLRFTLSEAYKEEIRSAASFMSLPQYSGTGGALIWETVSQIWKAVGDEAQGWEYYSKRATLFSIYSACFLYWLQDQEGNLDGFIDRRLMDIGNFAKFKTRIRQPFSQKPSVFKPKYAEN